MIMTGNATSIRDSKLSITHENPFIKKSFPAQIAVTWPLRNTNLILYFEDTARDIVIYSVIHSWVQNPQFLIYFSFT